MAIRMAILCPYSNSGRLLSRRMLPMARPLYPAPIAATGVGVPGTARTGTRPFEIRRLRATGSASCAPVLPRSTSTKAWWRAVEPAGEVATSVVVVMQALHDLSGWDAVAAMRCDIRWKLAYGPPLDHEGFHPTKLTYWRRRLAASDRPAFRPASRQGSPSSQP